MLNSTSHIKFNLIQFQLISIYVDLWDAIYINLYTYILALNCAKGMVVNLFETNEFDFQDTHNQAGIAHSGGLVPLLKLLDSKNGSLQHNSAFALYGLADNEV